MRARFLSLWSRLGGVRAEDVHADLARCYGEPTRHYHTLRHVRRCLRDFDWARDAIPETDAVELALWCHDVIYVPGARDNERRSAEWFRQWAGGTIAAADHIAAMILDTAHDRVPSDTAGRFTVDIDLAVLGYPRACFRRDGAYLRAERPDLDDAAYDRAERTFLSRLLDRPRIYQTDLFHARYEDHARRNLAWRLAQPVPSWAGRSLRGTLP